MAALLNSIPSSKPFWTNVAVDDIGYYWLRTSEEINWVKNRNHSWTYRILSPEGEYLGDTVAPPVLSARYTAANHAMAVSIRKGHFMVVVLNTETGDKELKVYRMKSIVNGFNYPPD